jgi:hypothetical protein
MKPFSYIQPYILMLQPPHVLLQLVLDPLDLQQLRLPLIYLQNKTIQLHSAIRSNAPAPSSISAARR